MSFKSIDIKLNYETEIDNILEDFYIPVLSKSVHYDRIAGFFSSSSLAISARGISGLIKNNGKMRMIVSPQLSKEDVESIENAVLNPSLYIENKFVKEISDIEDSLERDHVYSLGWLIAHDKLEIKIALVYSDKKILSAEKIEASGIFHQKVGILTDIEGNQLSFSGSINETAAGWLNNIEEFKTFKSWNPGQIEYFKNDQKKFQEFWKDERKRVKIFELPEAVKKEFLKHIPDDPIERLTINRYRKSLKFEKTEKKLNLFYYQKEAVDKWLNNNQKLLFEMATGTGKTRTAIGCIVEFLKSNKKAIVIVACPQNTLSMQWKAEIENLSMNFENSVVADSTQPKWNNILEQRLLEIKIGMISNIIVYTTHKTASSDRFISLIENNKDNTKILFIGDEVHGMGANKTKKGLLECYESRIGLSATPSRWFDDKGTKLISNYFNNKSFVFSIKDALSTINPLTGKTFLVNYYYKPIFVSLTDDEIYEYIQLSKKISKLSKYSSKAEEYLKRFENLLFQRADIHKSAVNKYEALLEVLDSIEYIKDLIVFVTPEQIEEVMKIMRRKSIVAHRFTQSEGTRIEAKYQGRSERQYIIDKFKEEDYKALVAIKCLDEGIDIPSASIAILMASSTNPREYIQRIGRVIRQAEGKSRATIYDMIILPEKERLKNKDVIEFEKKLFEKELVRIEEIATNAINNADALHKIYKVKGVLYYGD